MFWIRFGSVTLDVGACGRIKQSVAGGKAVDGALDVEQRVDALHRLQRDWRDGRRPANEIGHFR